MSKRRKITASLLTTAIPDEDCNFFRSVTACFAAFEREGCANAVNCLEMHRLLDLVIDNAQSQQHLDLLERQLLAGVQRLNAKTLATLCDRARVFPIALPDSSALCILKRPRMWIDGKRQVLRTRGPGPILAWHSSKGLTPEQCHERDHLVINGEHLIRHRQGYYSVVDAVQAISGKNDDFAGRQVREILRQHELPLLYSKLGRADLYGRSVKYTAVATATTVALVLERLPNVQASAARQVSLALARHAGISDEDFALATNVEVPRRCIERDEHVVGRWLAEAGLRAQTQVACAGKRIDFVIPAPAWDGVVMVEVDEEQHKGYGLQAEVQRVSILRSNYARCVLIRFNPGSFTVEGNPHQSQALIHRKDLLLKTIRQCLVQWPGGGELFTKLNSFSQTYLYYDMDKDCRPFCLRDIHYPPALAALTWQVDYTE